MLLQRGREALLLLLEAYQYAQEAQREVWDFAVEIDTLRQTGCTNSEFRWLVCRGFVDHALESTLAGDESRSFQRHQHPAGLTFGRRTCFVLTEAGNRFAQTALGDLVAAAPASPEHNPTPVAETRCRVNPRWDRERQELRLGEIVVKQFKVPAANQERILAAFEEEGWPVRIDDPLPPASEQDSKRRLHDTINSLNRNQKQPLIRFVGDGSGLGIRWELVAQPSGGSRESC
jgi:hypothetical protein